MLNPRSIKEKKVIQATLEKLYPTEPNIWWSEGMWDILDYDSSTLELKYNSEIVINPKIVGDHETADDLVMVNNLEVNYKDEFMLFFSIRIATESSGNLSDFIKFHLEHNFNNQAVEYKNFLQTICNEFKASLISDNRVKSIGSWIDNFLLTKKTGNNAIIDMDSDEATNSEDSRKKLGRKAKEKYEIPMPPERVSDDITTELIGFLFNRLRKYKYLHDSESVSNTNAAIAIRGLTGISKIRLRILLAETPVEDKQHKDFVRKLRKFIDLIDRELTLK